MLERGMKANRNVVSIIAVLCLAVLPISLGLLSAELFEGPNPTLFINPASISFEELVVGQRFTIYVTVVNITDLKSYSIKLSYNTVMLDVVSITLLPEEALPAGTWSVSDATGIIKINVTYDGPSITTSVPVQLAAITFKTMNRGQSPLHLYDTELKDSLGNPITHETADGLILILRHDVAIISVEPSTVETYVGNSIDVTVVAENEGDVAESFTVKVYYNDTLFGTSDIVDLGAGENTSIVFTWDTTGVAAGYSYPIKAEATTVPNESNTDNNLLVDGAVKIKLVGDVNNDNTVDINDLNAWDAAYGSHEGDLNWNVQADINGDGVVDNTDGILIVQNYHATA
jgi:hypothetical protein